METSVIDLLVPTDIQVDDSDNNTSKITLEPLERGFGHTLGNALRRILLSSMPGAAITDVTIDGISHEYSTIEGVREDVIDILLNLKDIPISLIEGTSAVIKLDVSGPCEVTSSSFEVPGNVELPDAEHHVASLVDKVSLSLSATVKTGRGYEPADARGEEETAVGALKVDASFSPVRRVAYTVENARFEKRTDLDKLIVELESDGTLDPKKAIEPFFAIAIDVISLWFLPCNSNNCPFASLISFALLIIVSFNSSTWSAPITKLFSYWYDGLIAFNSASLVAMSSGVRCA